MTTTGSQLKRPREEPSLSSARPRRRIRLPLLFGLLAILAGTVSWDVYNTPWFQDIRLSRLPLEALRRERDARNSHDPLLLYHIGRRLNERGRYAEADGYLREAVGRDPDSVRYRDAWARALLGSGLTTAAFGQLREFAARHPDSDDAHLLLGKFYVSQNAFRRAIEELTTATRLNAGLGEAWSYLAVAHQSINEPQPALAAAERAAALRPHNAGDHLLLAALRAGAGDTAGARRAFEETLTQAPRMAVAHREYAALLLKCGGTDVARAVTEAGHAVDLDGNDPIARLVLGRALTAQGHQDEAVTHLQRAAQQTPQDPTTALALAQTLGRLGREREAQAWLHIHQARQARMAARDRFLAALELNPHGRAANRGLAHLLAEDGDVEGCVQHHAEALRKPPDSPVTLAAAAEDLTTANHAREALPLARRASELAPANPQAIETMGDVLLALGRPQEAADYYDRVTAWEPGRYPVFRARLVRYYREQEAHAAQSRAEQLYRRSRATMRGQVRIVRVPLEALHPAEEAVRLEPANSVYMRHLLNLQFHANRQVEAIQTARRLLQLTPENPMTHALLAVMLIEHAGGPQDLAEAQAHLDRAARDASSEATWRYGCGLLALRRGQAAEAARHLREAARLDPRPAITFYRLSQAEATAGHAAAAAQARAEFERRHREAAAEAQALQELGAHPYDPQQYAQAAAVFDSYGRRADAEAIRAAASYERQSERKQKGQR